jgi:hypothetical protein
MVVNTLTPSRPFGVPGGSCSRSMKSGGEYLTDDTHVSPVEEFLDETND